MGTRYNEHVKYNTHIGYLGEVVIVPIAAGPSGYLKLLELDGIELSIHGRTFSQALDEHGTTKTLANGTLKKYIKAEKLTFDLNWEWLPSDSAATVDRNAGRDTLLTMIGSTGRSHLLNVYDMPSGTVLPYNVYVVDYSEEVLRRDRLGNRNFYKIQLSLKEK